MLPNNDEKVIYIHTRKRLTHFHNISCLLAGGDITIIIYGKGIRLSDGKGFYSLLSLPKQTSFKIKLKRGILAVVLKNGTLASIHDVESVEGSVCGESAQLLVRQPELTIEGKLIFRDAFLSYRTGVRCVWQNLYHEGRARMTIYASDTYTWLNSLTLFGTFYTEPPLLDYNELNSLYWVMLWSPILISVFIFIHIFWSRWRK